jgi:hypothetical protein
MVDHDKAATVRMLLHNPVAGGTTGDHDFSVHTMLLYQPVVVREHGMLVM